MLIMAGVLMALWLVMPKPTDPANQPSTEPSTEQSATSQPAGPPAPAASQPSPAAATSAPAPAASAPQPPVGLNLHVVKEPQQDVPEIGSTDPIEENNPFKCQVRFSPWGAGVKSIDLVGYYKTVVKEQPYRVQQRLVEIPRTKPDGADESQYRYPMAARTITVNEQPIALHNKRWKVVEVGDTTKGQAVFELTLVDPDNHPVLRLRRSYLLPAGRFELQVRQDIENLSDEELKVEFVQYGPGDMPLAGGYMGDKRNVRVGYFDTEYDTKRGRVFADRFGTPRPDLAGARPASVWPPRPQAGYELVWVAMDNRYFATALFKPPAPATADTAPQPVRMDDTLPRVDPVLFGPAKERQLLLSLASALIELAPAASGDAAAHSIDLTLYAGPKERDYLKEDPTNKALGLGQLIVYNFGGCCSMLTFAWLADFLVTFLRWLHNWAVFDWGLAIVALVAIVRFILHPITKYSQVNMGRVGKQMQALQPEMEKIRQKHGDNQQKINQDMMALYRDKGVNPASMGMGCLPMFLQMPIWVALYAMLFFAIELRHQPAFFDFFHRMGELFSINWPFLRDLSAPDRFIPLPEVDWSGIGWVFRKIENINLLPLLMAVVFYIQQKYMATPTMQTDQAKQQQKIMMLMMLLFPIFLYKAPSGLTLYILTSTFVGIIESKRVRQHIKEQEEAGTLFKPKKEAKSGGLWGRLQKAAEHRDQRLQGRQPGRRKKR